VLARFAIPLRLFGFVQPALVCARVGLARERENDDEYVMYIVWGEMLFIFSAN
jgi:hypothetical protein